VRLSIHPIERRHPRRTTVLGRFPKLAHASVRVRRPGDAVDVLPARGRLQNHLAIGEAAFEAEDVALRVDPELPPQFRGRVVGVVARAAQTLGALPVFCQRATVEDRLDAVVAGRSAVRKRDVPVADPEIELMRFRGGTPGRFLCGW